LNPAAFWLDGLEVELAPEEVIGMAVIWAVETDVVVETTDKQA
jgi:hypothetical protein